MAETSALSGPPQDYYGEPCKVPTSAESAAEELIKRLCRGDHYDAITKRAITYYAREMVSQIRREIIAARSTQSGNNW